MRVRWAHSAAGRVIGKQPMWANVAAPVSAFCAVYLGFAWLVLANFIGFSPFLYRARWTPEGLDVRWFFLRERLRL